MFRIIAIASTVIAFVVALIFGLALSWGRDRPVSSMGQFDGSVRSRQVTFANPCIALIPHPPSTSSG